MEWLCKSARGPKWAAVVEERGGRGDEPKEDSFWHLAFKMSVSMEHCPSGSCRFQTGLQKSRPGTSINCAEVSVDSLEEGERTQGETGAREPLEMENREQCGP